MFRKSISLLLLGVALTCSAAQAQSAGNRSNVPFATVSDGLLGPMVVDVPAGASRAAIDAAVSGAMRRGKPTRATESAVYEFLVRRGMLRPGSRLPFHRPVVLSEGGRLRLPDLERAQRSRGRLGGGEITFVYDNWSAADAANIDAFVQQMYPVAKQVYGSPSANITVHIVRDDTLTDATMHFRNGIYNASTNEIRLNPTTAFVDDMYSLTHLLLYAFHDDAIFAYDAWEEGFTWAATYVIFKQLRPEFDLGDSFKTFYFLPLYELLNKPGIGNARFWPASFDQIVATERAAVFPYTLFVFRSGMAAAAWIKVYVENNGFFRDFNAAYYQQFAPALAGNTPALKAIAASLAPNVEGEPFLDWYRRQYVLDTSSTAGRQLWVYSVPQFNREDNAGAHVILLVYSFTRDAAGNELPLAGTANLSYLSWDFVQDYFAEEGNQVAIAAAGVDAGVGTITPGVFNAGGSQKINVQVAVNGLTRLVYWPYLVRGQESDPNTLFGVTLDSTDGEVGVIVGSGQETKTPLSQAAFGLKAGLDGWHKSSIRVTDSGGSTATRQVNVGFDFYAAVLQGPRPSATAFTQTLPAGLNLVSVPAYPAVSDPDALGIAASRLLLAHWDPTLNTGDPNYRYRVYPGTPPLAPGIGYWLQTSQPVTISFQGNPPPQDQSALIPLHAGWNQIGHPFLQDVPVSSLRVLQNATDPSSAVDLSEAVAQGLLSGTFWGFAPGAGYAPAQALQPWRGYFISAQTDLLLLVPAVASPGQNPAGTLPPGNPVIGEGSTRAARVSRVPVLRPATRAAADGWRLRMLARVGGAAGAVIVGASRAASDGFDGLYDAQSPPTMGDYVRLGIAHADWGRAAGDYALDVRADGAAQYAWEITLETNLRNQTVQLSWPNLAAAPKELRFVLSDLDGGQRTSLRTTGSLAVNSGETGRRRFRLEATRSRSSLLTITGLTATPTRSRGMDVQFALSADAVVDAQVLGPTGRAVRQVTRSRAAQAGMNHLLWDGRSDQGVLLPAGLYLLQLTATTEEGLSVRATRPVVLVR